ncbi:hypothetical protein HYT56_05260 [Candidatus Woesearchaeota archaeon]|nr:hypothetical protein [Candidatus Woesearchaeota archaeon]
MTLTRIRYNPKGDDIVIHNYKQQNQYEIPVNFLGPNEVILSADNAQKPMQTLLDTKQSLQEINDAYKWLTGVNAYILRLSSRPKKQDEKIARFYAYSNEAIFDCGRNPLDSNPALGVKFYPKGRTKLKIY